MKKFYTLLATAMLALGASEPANASDDDLRFCTSVSSVAELAVEARDRGDLNKLIGMIDEHPNAEVRRSMMFGVNLAASMPDMTKADARTNLLAACLNHFRKEDN